MTGADLKAWRDRLQLTNREAAEQLALSLRGFQDQLYGQRNVSPRVARLAQLVEQQAREAS